MLDVGEVGRDHADLQRPGLEPVDHLADAARDPEDGLELGEEVRQECVRLESPLGLAQHHDERVLLDERHRVERRVEDARDRVGLGKRLADEREGRRQSDPVANRDPLEVGERVAGADLGERPPVVARQLPPQLVDEAGLVRADRR